MIATIGMRFSRISVSLFRKSVRMGTNRFKKDRIRLRRVVFLPTMVH